MKKKEKFNWLNLPVLFIAGVINATGVILMLTPAKVFDGGFSGTAVLLSMVTPLSVAIYLVCINIPFFIFGIKKIGFHFLIYSVVSVCSYALFSFLFQSVFHLDVKVYSLMEHDIFLAAVFGGVLSGIGSGLTIRFGGAIDGVEIMGIVFAKRMGITVGQFVMAYNFIIYIVAMIIFKDMAIGMYSIISYAIGHKVVDWIVDGFDKGKAFIVVTDNGNQVARVISEVANQGVTVLDSKGYFSNSHKTMLYCIVNTFEVVKLKKAIKEVDPLAFIAINDVSEVVGNKTKYNLKHIVKKNKTAPNLKKDIKVLEVASDSLSNEVIINDKFDFSDNSIKKVEDISIASIDVDATQNIKDKED